MNEHMLEEAVNEIDEKLIGKHVERKCKFSSGIANQQLQQANKQIRASEESQADLFAQSNGMFQKMWSLMSEEEKAKAMSEMNGEESV